MVTHPENFCRFCPHISRLTPFRIRLSRPSQPSGAVPRLRVIHRSGEGIAPRSSEHEISSLYTVRASQPITSPQSLGSRTITLWWCVGGQYSAGRKRERYGTVRCGLARRFRLFTGTTTLRQSEVESLSTGKVLSGTPALDVCLFELRLNRSDGDGVHRPTRFADNACTHLNVSTTREV